MSRAEALRQGGAWLGGLFLASSESATTEALPSSVDTVVTVSELRRIDPDAAPLVYVRGRSGAADGGGGLFVWDPSATPDNADGGRTFAPPEEGTARSGAQGLWRRTHAPDGVFNVRWWGAQADGTDDTAAIREALEAAMQNAGVCYFPAGDYRVTSTFVLDRPVRIVGEGQAVGRWDNPPPSATRITYDGDGDAFRIQSTERTGRGEHDVLEGIVLENVDVRPARDGGGRHGVTIDGSVLDDPDCRPVRNIRFTNVSIRRWGGHCAFVRGNCFDIRFFHCGLYRSEQSTVLARAERSQGTDKPGQLFFYDCGFESTPNHWALELQDAGQGHVIGGFVSGYGGGLALGNRSHVYLTHVEGGAQGAKQPWNQGIRLVGEGCVVRPRSVTGRYDVGIEIDAKRYEISCPIIKNEGRVGVHVTPGGRRDGTCWAPGIIGPTTPVRVPDDGAAGFVLEAAERRGGSAVRTSISRWKLQEGTSFYDVDLGLPLWYDGEAWTDAIGRPRD
jgi:hypothetical protein